MPTVSTSTIITGQTAQVIITAALRKCGQLRPGYTAMPELMTDLLNDWYWMFDEMNAERTVNYSNPDLIFPVTGPGSQSAGNGYDIGPSATDWIGPRPVSIIRANLVMTNAGQSPIYLHLTPITQEQWANLAIRQIPPISVTSQFWYDPQFPNGVFNVFPPLTAGNSIEIFTWGTLTPPASLDDVWYAPPGYADMVIWGLAERNYYTLTKEAVRAVSPYGTIALKAKLARDKVKRVNRPIPRLGSDFRNGNLPAGYYDSFIRWVGDPG